MNKFTQRQPAFFSSPRTVILLINLLDKALSYLRTNQ